MKNKIFAFIGVIGSGKDYQVKLKSETDDYKIFDFSDGVREFTWGFLGYRPNTNKDYSKFKAGTNVLIFSEDDEEQKFIIPGRRFLENVGSTMRKYDSDFWAKYCINSANNCYLHGVRNFIFNSVRYPNEAKFVINFAKKINADLNFIFTNYKSNRYEIRRNESEYFAQKLLKEGFDDLDNVTEYVINITKDV